MNAFSVGKLKQHANPGIFTGREQGDAGEIGDRRKCLRKLTRTRFAFIR